MKHRALLAALVAIVAILAPATTAGASTAPGYEEFADCPDKTAGAGLAYCAVSEVTGGHLQLGTKNTPITDPIKLVGSGPTPDLKLVVGSFDGGRQRVPGGIVGITGLDWLTFLFPFDMLKLYAEAELAGPPGSPLLPTISLPLKIHLDNPLISNSCYIGSDSNPVILNLVQGTTNPPPPNQPISGTPFTLGADPNLPGVLRLTDGVLVDNSFAVPGANGCDLLVGGFGLLDPLVNLQAGLPAPAGTNEAVQEADAAIAGLNNVYPPAGVEQ